MNKLIPLLAATAVAGGCAVPTVPATAPAAGTAAAAPAAGASAPRPAAAPVPGQPQPFATVVTGARRVDGPVTVWVKDDKAWFELQPADFGRPLFFGPKVSQGIGEQRLFGGVMQSGPQGLARQHIVEFRRVHNQVQLLARNNAFTAPAGSAGDRAVRTGFSPSLLGSAPVASQPHPDRKSVLVEANPLLLSDLLAVGLQLQRTYRQNYALDRANSAITQVRGKAGEVVFSVQAHYATATLAQAQPGAAAPAGPAPTLPRTVPDARSLFFGFHYALAALPAQPMQPRLADPRVGYFTSSVSDFGDDLQRQPLQRFVNRWRLEKKDPAAALSDPVRPITFWLDRSIPQKYRDAVVRGVLAWNTAFEKIGFSNAVVARVQPDDADFDTLDVGAASIRWLASAQPAFGGYGPRQVDTRSGEILDADIALEGLNWRNLRATRNQILGVRPNASDASTGVDWPALMQLGADARAPGDFAARPAAMDLFRCDMAEHMAEQLAYGLDVLEARGELDPGSPDAEGFVMDALTKTTMHEVGHALGLRHNFRSSRAFTLAQLADPEFVRANGLAGSVMEYPPVHLAAPGAKAVPAFPTVLGPYDQWAIEYGYKPLPPAQEAAELQRIAARNAEPQLAYGTDEDAGLGLDPDTLTFDLGPDPVAFAALRLDIARDLLQRQATRELPTNADYSVLRRSVGYALRDMATAAGVLARQIGGVRTLRDFPGSGRDPLQPVEAAVQRNALDLLARHYLAADAVQLPAQLQRRLAPDFMDRTDALFAGDPGAGTDFSPGTALLEMQRTLLNQLLSDGVAQRILDSAGKALRPDEVFALSELYDRLGRDIWSELDAKAGDVPGPRRELQREHASRLAAQLLRPGTQGRADARSLLRQQAQSLLPRLDAAQRRPGLSAEARAHLADVAEQLRQALQARMNRPA
jgi:hypothetical protein